MGDDRATLHNNTAAPCDYTLSLAPLLPPSLQEQMLLVPLCA